ncbi:MAG: flavodoxin family protein [Candidatus Omnitrophica bacterium]|nr:flavodoxin family protein [Candidatus Omnitrophota bacterium]
MRCLGILAGPRKGHATDKLIDTVLEGLKERGGEVEKISLYDYNIKPCTGCCACHKTGKCAINDDYHIVRDKVEDADVVVFGSPAYWCNVTSEAKKFMDRSGVLFEMKTMGPKRTKDKPSKVVLVATCGAPFPLSHMMGIIPGVMRAMKEMFCRMNAKVRTIYAAGMMDPDNSLPSKRLMDKARELGRNI